MQAIKHWFFMFFHHHEWKICERCSVNRTSDGEQIAMNFIHRCKICGKMKSETLY